MTKRNDPNASFVRFGSYKMECNAKLLEAFREACAWSGCTMTTVLRQLMQEFVDQAMDAAVEDTHLTALKDEAKV